LPRGPLPSALRVGVLHDFIPWIFQAQYLSSPVVRKWYEERLAALPQFDLLLAVSEATRRDAIDILRLAPERIVNISEAAGALFRPLPAAECSDIARFGIARPFVLYTGNVDYRKNQDGMLRAYAGLPLALRQSHQLVLNQAGDPDAFRRRLQALGLREEEVVVNGHISDDDLVSLYSQCKVFVFPSLYEGFGLPALEAMACGAPVIAANNSSIPEVVGRSDALFDAADQAAITAALHRVLTDDAWRQELARHGLERARTFTWEQTAQRAWRAIEERLAAKATRAPAVPRPRIALVGPLAPHDAPALRHCASAVPLLARHAEIDWFVEEGTAAQTPPWLAGVTVYPHTQLALLHARYATVVYQMANSAAHAYLLPLMAQFPGVVVLHDAALDAPVRALAERPGMAAVLPNEILYCHGVQGLLAHLQPHAATAPLLLNRHVLEAADRLLVTDPAHLELLQQANPGAWLPPAALLPADPLACAEAYRHAIDAAIGCHVRHTIGNLADALAGTAPDQSMLDAIGAHAAGNWRVRKQPRLLIDVTQLARSDLGSGIQRVVRNIAYEIAHLPGLRRPLELVQQKEGRLWRAGGVIAAVFGVPAEAVPPQEVLIQPGDTLLMLDSSWEQYGDFEPVFQAVRQAGGSIVTVIYDLIPLRLPHLCIPALVRVFDAWFPLAVRHSDALLCISRSVADEVRAWLAGQAAPAQRKPAVLHWPLGADLAVRGGASDIRAQVRQLAEDKGSALFLMVGTLEPRKGHAFVLDAFEQLWRSGAEVRLCLAGSVGWIEAGTLERIRRHPQLNKRLFFVEKFTDAEINLCYAAATALIAASAAEGFGLPIVEAALHRVPALVSDIPVFREVGGDGACYFALDDARHLAEAVAALAAMPAQQRLEMAARIPTVTWRHSAQQLLLAIGIDTNEPAPLEKEFAPGSGTSEQSSFPFLESKDSEQSASQGLRGACSATSS
jgi:glycosyltransferase involved in cell wall biosynthesis